jgi:oxaloacetate decarboxylase (Na+ extruding) subunit gamma
MSESMSVALQLLLVGMLTVFAVLFLVVGIGNVIVRFVNRYLPEEEKIAVAARTSGDAIDPKKVAAITSAVATLTKGKGKVVTIEKI